MLMDTPVNIFAADCEDKECKAALVQIGSCGDFGRGRCVDPETDQAANAACQMAVSTVLCKRSSVIQSWFCVYEPPDSCIHSGQRMLN